MMSRVIPMSMLSRRMGMMNRVIHMRMLEDGYDE